MDIPVCLIDFNQYLVGSKRTSAPCRSLGMLPIRFVVIGHYSPTLPNTFSTMMNTATVFALLVASASAFAPSSKASSSSSSGLRAVAPEKEIGAQAPLGYFEYVKRLVTTHSTELPCYISRYI